MGAYMDWRDKQLISPDKQLTQDQLDVDPYDSYPFEQNFHDCALAGYEATIKGGDGALEWQYQSILVFLGLPTDELTNWRASLISALSTKLRTKFEASQQAHLDQIEHAAQRKVNKGSKKKIVQTVDPLAGVTGDMKTNKKVKAPNKPKTGAKGATRKYANQIAKENTEQLI